MISYSVLLSLKESDENGIMDTNKCIFYWEEELLFTWEWPAIVCKRKEYFRWEACRIKELILLKLFQILDSVKYFRLHIEQLC